MIKTKKKTTIIYFFYFFIFFVLMHNSSEANTNIVEKISIDGNERISDQTIILFSEVELNENLSNQKINEILKNLYETYFFEDIKVKFEENELIIKVVEAPIINEVIYNGIKADRIKDVLNQIVKLKSRSSFNEFLVENDRYLIKEYFKNIGYYFASVETVIENLDNNLVKVVHNVDMGNRAKIKKISFVGDKIYKDSKLKNIIVSEEYKFWKFISGKKYLNEQTINLDERLLKNFYKNKGYYNVKINTSFAKLIDEENFELIFNIDTNEKIYFNNLSLDLPDDFNRNNFNELIELFKNVKGEHYSLNIVNNILKKLDLITLNEEYKSIEANVVENITNNKLDLNFVIKQGEIFIVEQINIFGNNITRESVIRNNLEIDEGDPFNPILQKKSENNLKSLNFFRSVSSQIISGQNKNTKIININVEEKPTGEIQAGAGVGTSGGTFQFGISENNYLGKGLGLDANFTVNSESFKGVIGLDNPNYNNSDKALFGNLQATEIDRMTTNGYKTNKTGFELGTRFEYYEDFNFGLSTRSFYEKIETDSTASTRQQAQEGNYWDTFFNLSFDYDKRNQKFQTDDGFRSLFTTDIPIISDTYTLTNSYSFQKYTSFYDNNISSFSFYFENANSIKGEDIKLTERLFIPTNKLRGFERGKVGPKDGADFIGGNNVAAINFNTTLPVIFENNDAFDATLFLDIANIWGVDYDKSINETNKIRSSIGVAFDWFTAVGPLNFSLTQNISKADTDITESFRFNLGTSF